MFSILICGAAGCGSSGSSDPDDPQQNEFGQRVKTWWADKRSGHLVKSDENVLVIAELTGGLSKDIDDLTLLKAQVDSTIALLNKRKNDVEELIWTTEDDVRKTDLLNRSKQQTPEGTQAVNSATSTPAPGSEPADSGVSREVLAFYDEKFSYANADLESLDSSLYNTWASKLQLKDPYEYAYSYGYQYEDDGPNLRSACRYGGNSACENLLRDMTETRFVDVKEKEIHEIEQQVSTLELSKVAFEIARKARSEQRSKLISAYGSAFDGMLSFAVPVVGFIVLLMFMVAYWPRRKNCAEAKNSDSDDVVSIITVLLLVSLILILALADKLAAEALGTLIGGIAAYVLGDNVKGRRRSVKKNGPRGDGEPSKDDEEPGAEPPKPVEPKPVEPAQGTEIAEMEPVASKPDDQDAELRGRASAVLEILDDKKLQPTDDQAAQILSCKDVARLRRWLSAATKVEKVEDLLAIE